MCMYIYMLFHTISHEMPKNIRFPAPVLAIKGKVGDGGELTVGDWLLICWVGLPPQLVIGIGLKAIKPSCGGYNMLPWIWLLVVI